MKILGNPSTTSKFDNDVWIYIERKQTQSQLKRLGKMKIYKNDILILEIDDYGILKKKEFYNKDDMEKIKIVEATTEEKPIAAKKALIASRTNTLLSLPMLLSMVAAQNLY